jgi:Transposase DDE domain
MGFNIHILSGRNRSTNLAGHAALAASFNPNLDSSQKQPALKHREIRAAIPSTASRRTPYPLDRAASKRRNVIERMFCKLKNCRRIATRYDRLARNYLSSLALAAIIIAWT